MSWDPEREVPGFEPCKKLKELGYPQNKYGFYWIKLNAGKEKWKLIYWSNEHIRCDKEGDYILLGGCSCCAELFEIAEKIKAPTCRELGEWSVSYTHLTLPTN